MVRVLGAFGRLVCPRAVFSVLLVLSASTASAQVLANGTGDAITVNRGDVVTINAAGLTRNYWVGLYAIGATDTAYQDWFHLNGLKTLPPAAINPASFGFPVRAPAGEYEFRLFSGSYNFVARSGGVTIRPPAITVNGVAAPNTVVAEPAASMQVEVTSGPGTTTSWVGIYRDAAPNASYLDWFYLNGAKNAPSTGLHAATLTMTLPAARGPYEFRFFSSNGTNNNHLVTSTTVITDLITPIAGGDAHTLVARPTGVVRSVGGNGAGQLGDGTTVSQTVPVELSGLGDVVSVAAGKAHSLALSSSGEVYAWGSNEFGQIGDDSLTDRATPTLLTLTDVVAVAAGDDHSLALTAAGELFAWGLNDLGQLGTGNTTSSSVPIQVATSVLSIGAGGKFSLFVKMDGTVWGMGDNQWGMLGNGSYTNRTSPGQMSGVTKAVAVQSGSQHSLILLQNGTVWSTGRNNFGQMGVASPPYRSTPALMGSLSNIVTIAAGDNFSLALDKDGVVWGWGDNASGQLGSAAPSYRTVPAIVEDLSGIKYIAAGAGHTIAANANRTISSVGANASGQLGDGTTTNRFTALASDGLSEQLATPRLSVSTGTFESDFNVVVTAGSANSVMRYTTNGTDPTEVDPTVASGSTVAIDHSLSLKVKAWQADWLPSAVAAATYEMRVATPSLSPGSGTLTAPTGISISTLSAGSIIRYTVDGSDPTSSSPQYSGPITVATATTVKARGFKGGWSDSDAGAGSYVMNLGTLELPSIAPATGTYAVGLTVVISGTQPGATIRYTTDGSSPTGSSPIYASPIEIQASPATITAKAFHQDYTASGDASRVYTLAAPPPTIEPATGTFTTAQTVSITASAGAVIRYTTDGSDPTEASSPYSGPLMVDAGLTLKARAFPTNGWAASATTSATLTFNYGTLDPPSATPAGGAFASAPQVALSSVSGASIFYTLNGSTPTASSTPYAGPITIPPAGAALKSIAFHSDWSPSAVRSDLYVVDTTAPTIEPQFVPAQIDSWSRSPVTVNFFCSDNLQVTSCSSPSTFTEEGAGQLVTAMATDTAGNQSQLPVTLNLDFSPPAVTLTSPIDGSTTSNSTLQVTGQVADPLSGLASVKCNNVTATIVDDALSCDVPLRPGRNVVVISARDVAGNNVSQGITVTLVGTVTEMFLTPSERTMLVGETATLSFRDAFGISPSLSVWQTSDDTIVALSAADPPVLTALAEGQATITAWNGSIGRAAQVTVVAADEQTGTLPAGTTRWTLSTTMSSQSMRTAPIYTHRVEANGPDFFTVEPNFTTGEYTVRAVSESGGVLWKEAAPGLPLMGDSYGAAIAGVEQSAFRCALYWGEDRGCFTAFVRFGGSATALPWRYDSAGYLDRPAQSPDGTIYAIEHLGGFGRAVDNDVLSDYGNNKTVVILDGATGHVLRRVPLPTEYWRTPCGLEEREPRTHGPFVNSDGDAYLLVHREVHVATGTCGAGVTVAHEVGWTLLRLTRAGQVGSIVVDSTDALTPRQFMPDGVGGSLIRAEERLIRFDANWQRTEQVISAAARIDLVGQAGTIYLQTRIGNDDFYGITEALNVTTFTSLWTKSPGWNLTAAKPDGGGTALDSAGQLLDIDSTGQLASTTPFGLARPVQVSGGVTGQGTSTAELKAIAFDSPDATQWYATLAFVNSYTYEPSAFGNHQQQLAIPKCETYTYTQGWKFVLPGSQVTYDFAGTWPPSSRSSEIVAAFNNWTSVNIVSGLNTTFTGPVASAMLTLRVGPIPPVNGNPVGAGINSVDTDANDVIQSAVIFWQSDTSFLSSNEGFLVSALHEIGHLLGLADTGGSGGSSVMNKMAGPNDKGKNLPRFVPTCDQKAAHQAQYRTFP